MSLFRKKLNRVIEQYESFCWDSRFFSHFAKKIRRYQIHSNKVYQNWAHYNLSLQKEIPGLPIIAFKESKVCSFPCSKKNLYFQSSGTTHKNRSRHYFRSLKLYRTSVIAGWKWQIRLRIADCGLRNKITNSELKNISSPFLIPRSSFYIGLMPSSEEAPHSSLSRMLAILIEEFGNGNHFWAMKKGKWIWQNLCKWLHQIERQPKPIVIFGTAFGWVHFLDWCAIKKHSFKLPKSALVIETGGYKGQSRQIEGSQLHREVSKLLGLSPHQIRSEYSMCELSSQAYSFPTQSKVNLFRFPPWCRYRVVQPGTWQPVKKGSQGILEIHDLANLDSCAFLRTEDLVINHQEGFELIGRLPSSELKGCSLNFESKICIKSDGR